MHLIPVFKLHIHTNLKSNYINIIIGFKRQLKSESEIYIIPHEGEVRPFHVENREVGRPRAGIPCLTGKCSANKNIYYRPLSKLFLYQASRPILRVMTNGELIEIETPNTRLAARYMELHDRLR